MTDESKAWIGAIAGGLVGGIAGYLFFTEHGRSFRRKIEPVLDEMAQELVNFRHAVEKAARIANQGRSLLGESSPF